MKNLLLLLLAVYFYSNPVAATNPPPPGSFEFRGYYEYSKCPGSEPSKEEVLRPYKWMFLITDKKTRRILSTHTILQTGPGAGFYWHLKEKNAKNFDATKDLHVVVGVQTAGNIDVAYGFDNQIFYGDAPDHTWYLQPKTSDVLNELGTTPFRFGKISFQMQDSKSKKWKNVFEAKEGSACNHDNYEAWIANHGIYRIEKTDKGELFFSNLYYWPRTGMIFT